MSGSEWGRYLNGETPQYNFSYNSPTYTAPSATTLPPPPSSAVAPVPPSNQKLAPVPSNIKIAPVNNFKKLKGGKRKTRKNSKRSYFKKRK